MAATLVGFWTVLEMITLTQKAYIDPFMELVLLLS